MMRVSEFFKLDRTQPELDFVDVDVTDDVPLFLDPHAIQDLRSEWAEECSSLIQHFFQTIIGLISGGSTDRAGLLLSSLREPNETHLGLCLGRSKGRGMGDGLARDVYSALHKSEAARTGLLEDLEDTVLMVEGVDRDIVSDITTNLIREPLIQYTQDACRFYGIPLVSDVDSGPIWNPRTESWRSQYVSLPTIHGRRLLLIPKVIVRRTMHYDAGEYYRHYILEELRREEMNAPQGLVKLLSDGRRRVTFKSLKEKYGSGKPVIVRETLRHPDLLKKYREDKKKRPTSPMSHADLSEASGVPLPDWGRLIGELHDVKHGNPEAARYEKAIEKLLSVLFYPALTNPRPQTRLHDGRKRIDISYTNAAEYGFFRWLSLHYPAPQVFVECKNYSGEVGNPELDQLSGRFSPSRGRVGLLVCRGFDDKARFIKRCIDTAADDRGYIIPLDDKDLDDLTAGARRGGKTLEFPLLRERFERLIHR